MVDYRKKIDKLSKDYDYKKGIRQFAQMILTGNFSDNTKFEEIKNLINPHENDLRGIFPLNIGAHKLFSNIRDSFDHGMVLLVDYSSFEKGYHNWNMKINKFYTDFEFGKSDIDFQIDPMQIVEAAQDNGFSPLTCLPLEKYSKGFENDFLIPGPFFSSLIKTYEVMCFKF